MLYGILLEGRSSVANTQEKSCLFSAFSTPDMIFTRRIGRIILSNWLYSTGHVLVARTDAPGCTWFHRYISSEDYDAMMLDYVTVPLSSPSVSGRLSIAAVMQAKCLKNLHERTQSSCSATCPGASSQCNDISCRV